MARRYHCEQVRVVLILVMMPPLENSFYAAFQVSTLHIIALNDQLIGVFSPSNFEIIALGCQN